MSLVSKQDTPLQVTKHILHDMTQAGPGMATPNRLYVLPQQGLEKLCACTKKKTQHKLYGNTTTFIHFARPKGEEMCVFFLDFWA